ncbi:FadR/GntR family transcriptional regulator [Pararoseomonas indoligenes]|uniref:FadR family transcriptional regulator n=1 Tax=Roseomonas indoligenes TaxID=2820811 RepID=A0A940S9V6_9PROT|nr:FCD domain-containing protein [Pararoseomonas indoligenes]MBP0495688.1 FadR family transcriptional regulator [Pararoseomonas indoligenes]
MRDEALLPAPGLRLSERVIERIGRLVEAGEVRRDARFPSERALETRWGVSRLVIREAFRALEVQGVVESRPGGGRFLRADRVPDLARLRRIRLETGRVPLLRLWEAREAVEAQAAALAALRATPAQRDAIARPLRLTEALAPEALRHTNVNAEFHLAIARACGNPVLEELIGDLISRSQAEGFRHLLEVEDWSALQAGHRPILDAIAARDPEAARRSMAEHFAALRRRLDRDDLPG